MVLAKGFLILVCASLFSVAQAEDKATEKTAEKTTDKPAAAATEKGEEKAAKKETAGADKAASAKKGKSKMINVVMETSMGKIEIELNSEKAPISTENFLKYVDSKHYDGTIFHRVIDGFMIQGGGFNDKMAEKKGSKPITNEAANGLKNARGSIAMARTNDPNSATAQFYINVNDNKMLDYRDPSPMGIGYAVFGKVTSGMDVVDKIKAVPTGEKNHMEDVPTTPVVIKSVKRK